MIDPIARQKAREWLAARAPEAERYRREQAVEHIYIPRQAKTQTTGGRIPLYDVAAAALGDVPLQYLEFGVFGGRSIAEITKRFRHPEARFFGFDSFEGLPEDWGGMTQATFSTGGRPPAAGDPRVTFVKGWFQNTLPDFLAAARLNPDHAMLVHYDADLYTSTLFILTTLWHHISEYHFIFDEFMSEEIIALYDFSRAYPIELEFLCQTNAGGYPAQTFGRIRRVSFAPAVSDDSARS
jgi:hypothetical protein